MRIISVPGSNYFLFLLILLSIITGCSTGGHRPSANVKAIKSGSAVDLRDSSSVKSKLLKQYGEWRKTPYRMGGMSKRGVDCSGFVYITFRSQLGFTIPRTTDSQVKIGRKVARNNLRVGDLVFFQTSLFYNHVGIYLGDSKFLHASTSKGVIISSLNEKYWRKCYWTARRIDR
ncbi:MAG TPA: cell wall hydrolase [Desulfobacterales bacterium]|nr:cell wall hydrolase [Desulfobacterales bacterium]HIP38985.1 cell wall hydrolase [Desulfocapsa sulfexigens]